VSSASWRTSSASAAPCGRSAGAFSDPPRVPLRWFLERVAAREPFAFTRWGDGEWLAVLEAGEREPNPEQDFLPAMCAAIRDVLLSRPPYRLGAQPYAMRQHGEVILPFVEQHRLGDLDWIWGDVFQHANIRGRLALLVSELREIPLIFVGPAHLERVSAALGARRFVQAPSHNAYLELERLRHETTLALEAAPSPTFVSVSIGVAANILIHQLHERFPGHMLCDTGSIWDVHAGVKSRRYMHKIEVPPIPALDSTQAGHRSDG
jgi:hypothetical protein